MQIFRGFHCLQHRQFHPFWGCRRQHPFVVEDGSVATDFRSAATVDKYIAGHIIAKAVQRRAQTKILATGIGCIEAFVEKADLIDQRSFKQHAESVNGPAGNLPVTEFPAECSGNRIEIVNSPVSPV